jgi:hypothetical protein
MVGVGMVGRNCEEQTIGRHGYMLELCMQRAAKLYLTYLLLPLIPLQINGLRVEGEQPSLRLRIVGLPPRS